MQMDLDPHLHRGCHGSRAAVLRRRLGHASSSASDDEVGGFEARPQGALAAIKPGSSLPSNQPEDMMSCNDDLRAQLPTEAELARRPSDRYLAAHLAALRVVAIVLTHRAPPGTGGWTAVPECLADAGRCRPGTR